MQYVGGKQKSGGHHIAEIVKRVAANFGANEIVEPMCGGLSVTQRLAGWVFHVEARDACRPLIALYLAVRDGWVPPAEVTREEWERYKVLKDDPDRQTDPMLAFVGFGCSRSGAWFSSYVADYKYTKRRVPAATAARDSLRKKLFACTSATFVAGDYADAPVRGVWYCDKPYVDAIDYPAVAPFDHQRFWAHVNDVSERVPVLVSERCDAPEGWCIVSEWSVQQRLTTATQTRKAERLMIHTRWQQLTTRS